MTTDLRKILSDGISDETAYRMVNFLYHLASSVESILMGQVMRYEKTLTEFNEAHKTGKPWNKNLSDPPF